MFSAFFSSLLLFGVQRLNPILNPPAQTARLTLSRVGGLSVYPEQAHLYQELIPVILAHAVGAYTYATPDCPEVYYLSGLLNPTRTQYDFFDDTENRTRRILGILENHNVNVVVINEEPAFSQPVPAALLEALDERFTHSTDIGHFECVGHADQETLAAAPRQGERKLRTRQVHVTCFIRPVKTSPARAKHVARRSPPDNGKVARSNFEILGYEIPAADSST